MGVQRSIRTTIDFITDSQPSLAVITFLDFAILQEAKRIEPGLKIEMGVDNVITDKPAEMRSVLQERAGLLPAEKLALQLRRKLLNR